MIIIDPSNPGVTLINVFDVEPERSEKLADLLSTATDTVMRHLPGFTSAAIHRSADGTRVVNYAQWDNAEAYHTMLQNPEAQEHMTTCAELANHFSPLLYTVESVHEAPSVILDADRSTSVLVLTAGLEPRDLDAVLRTSVGQTERFVAATPDFAGAAWLIQAPHPAAGASDTERVVQLVQWAKATAAESFSENPIYSAHLRELQPMLRAVDTEMYYLDEVVGVDQPRRATIEDTKGSGADFVNAIITFEPEAGSRDWLNDYNQSETREHIRHLTGFVSASFLVAERTERLVEFVQWRSPKDLRAASLDERFREHANVSNHYSRSEMRTYHVHRTLGV